MNLLDDVRGELLRAVVELNDAAPDSPKSQLANALTI
jgi:hypothetical protein